MLRRKSEGQRLLGIDRALLLAVMDPTLSGQLASGIPIEQERALERMETLAEGLESVGSRGKAVLESEVAEAPDRKLSDEERGSLWVQQYDNQVPETERGQLGKRTHTFETGRRALAHELKLFASAARQRNYDGISKWVGLRRFAITDDDLKPLSDPREILREAARIFADGARQCSRVHHEVSSLHSKFLARKRPETLRSLLSVLDDDSSYEIAKAISAVDVDRLERNDIISFNEVYEARDRATGEALIVKVTGNKLKARVESAANYFLSRHDKLKNVVAPGLFPEPIEFDGMYITVQKKVDTSAAYNAHHYMASLAMLHTFGSEAMMGSKVELPEYTVKCFEKILDEMGGKVDERLLRRLKSRYEDVAAEVMELGVARTIHGDTKRDNLKTRLLDLEGMSVGDPVLDISLYLTQSEIPQEQWGLYVQTYTDVIRQETGRMYGLAELREFTGRVRRAAILTGTKELGGLCSRRMGKKQKKEARILYSFLSDAA